MAKEKGEFLKYQDQILDNLEALRASLENCKDLGMEDINDVIYNEILDLIDEVKGSDSLLELSAAIAKGKSIETRIDGWLSKEGITNIELIWPDI